jgi:hypothetical protein
MFETRVTRMPGIKCPIGGGSEVTQNAIAVMGLPRELIREPKK